MANRRPPDKRDRGGIRGGARLLTERRERHADDEPQRHNRENGRGMGMRRNDRDQLQQEQKAQRGHGGDARLRPERRERNADDDPQGRNRENWRGVGMRRNDHDQLRQEQRAQRGHGGGAQLGPERRERNADEEQLRRDRDNGRGMEIRRNDRDRPPQEGRARGGHGRVAPLHPERRERNADDDPGRHGRENRRGMGMHGNDQDRPRGRGGGRPAGTGGRPNKRMNAKTLQELTEQEPSEIVLTLANLNNGFKEALNTCPVPILLSVLAKAFMCNSTTEALNVVFMTMKQKNFFTTVIGYFMEMMTRVSEIKTHTLKQPIRDMITIMEELTEKNPNSITEVLGIYAALQMVIDTLSVQTNIIDEEILERFKEFTEIKDRSLTRAKRANVKVKPEDVEKEKDLRGPPNDFREIDIFPQNADMQITDDFYLRSNKVKGQYDDLDHYLDVQFRLLREDFIAPLRDGIAEYIEAVGPNGRMKKRLQDVRIYNSVKIIAPYCIESGICYTLQFDVSRLRIRWQSSKRLIYGSLLCLSPDVFETLYFATVVNRDVKLLQQGIVQVRFEVDHTTAKTLLGVTFTMAETTAYFESYRHNLVGLQKIREGDLPFENYIIKCENEVKPPAYVRRVQGAKIDLRPLVDEDHVIMDSTRLKNLGDEVIGRRNNTFSERSKPAQNVSILRKETWPPADLLHLDASQYEAIHTALTKEFVITQGPPGTGKTYIGLKIVKALLHNKELWSKDPVTGNKDLRPMLIVCYTNHALDQFLEGIVQFYKGDVLRVGGRSNSEALKPFNLHNFRQRFRHARSVPAHIFHARRDSKNEMDSLYTKINSNSQRIQIASTQILREDFLQPFIGRRHYTSLTEQFAMILQDAGFLPQQNMPVIVEWLGLGNFAPLLQMEDVAAPRNAVMNEEPNEDAFVDVVDEIDAMQADRQLDDESDSDEDLAGPVPKATGINAFHSRKKENDLKVQRAAKEQMQAVALSVDKIGNVPAGLDEGEWQTQKKAKKKLKKKTQKNLASADTMTDEEASRIVNMWTMSQENKWRLYRLWIKKYTDHLWKEIEEQEKEYEAAASRYREALLQEDKEIMRQSTVIGMTTTGAARYQSILQEINPRIIVVEEAAEVLEAHIVTTLSKGCEQLILIGDHKQLKPNPTVYRLAKDYNLDISLFERMVSNGVRCDCLALQHRMRPEISELMKHIYDKLDDHEDVKMYDSIRGVSCDMYFINHNSPESNDEDLRSHSNVHEATYIVGLCKYLLLQGYKPEQITVLTTYSGQLFCLKKQMPRHLFEGVKVTVVDNYQGEENDIILLSLVRSNDQGNIGFLKISNRVCVALSRAKKGFYVIGDFDLLASKSDLWKAIKTDMEKKGRLGDGLILYCQNHPDSDGIIAKDASDFGKAPEGGCSRKCEFRLKCGHVCQMYCHIEDKQHMEYKCRKTCNKILCENEHRCEMKCYKKCEKCMVLVEKTLPKCGHKQMVPCQKHVADVVCRNPCTKILSCGHKCQSECGRSCTERCRFEVQKTWACGHTGRVMCFESETALCTEPCNSPLSCEHICSGTCGSCFEGRLHKPCRNACQRNLVCGHHCKAMCNLCPPCTEKCQNRCKHSKCNQFCGEPCAPCMEPCEWKCAHYQCKRLCHEPCDRPRCNVPCPKRLTCGHKCIGLCGEPCPNDCRICDEEKVKTIFFGDEDEDDARFVVLEDCLKRCIIEHKAMDKYMDTKVEKGEIKLKCCPKCNTPIRRNLRYGNQIKTTLKEIEAVKKKVLADKHRIDTLQNDIKDELVELQAVPKLTLKRRLKDMPDPKSEHALVALKNQIAIIKAIERNVVNWKKLSGITLAGERTRGLRNLEKLHDWAIESRTKITPQEIEDAELEIKRSDSHFQILYYQMKVKEQDKVLDSQLRVKIRSAEDLLTRRGKYVKKRQDVVHACLAELKEKYSGIGVSDAERLMIVKAMDLPKGHWFKCPKGHVYAIGDCGGATVESKCPECRSTIGGSGHRLRGDNQFAGEMDGASHAAWSEQANLLNYGFNARF